MSKKPWKILDRIDGGGPRDVQGRGKVRRGIKFMPSGNIPMPAWMRSDIADVTPALGVEPAAQVNQAEASKDLIDRRSAFDRKHDIRVVDGQRVAHITPDQFRESFITPSKLNRLRREVQLINVSDGIVQARFHFSKPELAQEAAIVMSQHIISYGVAGTLKMQKVAAIQVSYRSPVVMGYLILTEAPPELRAHVNLSEDPSSSAVHTPVSGQLKGNLHQVFESEPSLAEFVSKDYTKAGREITVSQVMPDGQSQLLVLGKVWQPGDVKMPIEKLPTLWVRDFRTGLAYDFRNAVLSRGSEVVKNIKGVVFTAQNNKAPIAVFIPADYAGAAPQLLAPTA